MTSAKFHRLHRDLDLIDRVRLWYPVSFQLSLSIQLFA